jgi:hypothetical protein
MDNITRLLPFASCITSFVFAGLLIRRYLQRKGLHLLLWAVGMVFYGIGGFAEAYYVAVGWEPTIYRLWYLFGAILVAAWLGQGTIYLLARRRWAHVLMAVLGVASLFAVYRVFAAELNPALMSSSLHTGGELSGQAIVSEGVRTLTPFFNVYGTVALVGGAAWSAWIFWRKRLLPHRVAGNILIAAGALLPAFGGALSRFGIPSVLYLAEFLGAILMFAGFIRATSPLGKAMAEPTDKPATH